MWCPHLLKVEFNACKILSRAVSEWRYSSDGYVKVLLKMPQQFNCKKCISARPGHLSVPSVEERERKKLSWTEDWVSYLMKETRAWVWYEGLECLIQKVPGHVQTTVYKIATNKDLLYSTGYSAQYSVMAHVGKDSKKEWTYVQLTHFALHLKLSIVNQLYSNKNLKLRIPSPERGHSWVRKGRVGDKNWARGS